jgi:prepilin-type N-terminal cleavage/methylation domain-containing protein
MISDRTRHAFSGGSRTAGFTLLEVLVALAISGLCLMMLSGIVGRLATTQRALHDHAAILDQQDAVIRLLRNLLRSVATETKDATGPNLSGRNGELIVRSQGPAVLDLEAETTFRLHVVAARDPAQGGSGTLALAWTNPTTGTSFDETIATGVASFQLAYRARGGDQAWADSWARPVADLALVRIGLAFAGVRGTTSTSAVLAVGTRLPQACVVNALLDRCPQW